MTYKKPIFIGVDEVGRGALAGSVVAAAASWKYDTDIIEMACYNKITDSKLLSKLQRARFFKDIEKYTTFSISTVCSKQIDEYNILAATMLAMRQAIVSLIQQLSQLDKNDDNFIIYVDGPHNPFNMKWHTDKMDKYIKYSEKLSSKINTIIRGDRDNKLISAASILAKVYRDQEMDQISINYPHYYLKQNKGYGTRQHIEAINIHGISEYHRKTFFPCSLFI